MNSFMFRINGESGNAKQLSNFGDGEVLEKVFFSNNSFNNPASCYKL